MPDEPASSTTSNTVSRAAAPAAASTTDAASSVAVAGDAPPAKPGASAAASPLTQSQLTEPPPEVAHQAPPIFQSLFREGRILEYTTTDEVDPHDPKGGRTTTRLTIRCRISRTTYSGAWGAEHVCGPVERRNDDVPEVVRELAFISSPGGLWIMTSLPATQAELASIIKEPPTIAEVPKAHTRTFERRGPSPDDAEPCTEKVEVGRGVICREERCNPKTGYGKSRSRLCFSRERGLESLHEENLMGPRTVHWQLLRVDP